MQAEDLPTLNAALNSVSLLALVYGYLNIRRGRIRRHVRAMVGALLSSTLFLMSYLTYHIQVGSVPYPHHDWTRPLYFAILIPHILLAVTMLPFVCAAVWHGWRGQYRSHRRVTRILWPVWIFVSASGVVIYLMLYQIRT